jgi:hypothetical protein
MVMNEIHRQQNIFTYFTIATHIWCLPSCCRERGHFTGIVDLLDSLGRRGSVQLLSIVFVNPELFSGIPQLCCHFARQFIDKCLWYPTHTATFPERGPPSIFSLLYDLQDFVFGEREVIRIVGVEIIHTENRAYGRIEPTPWRADIRSNGRT